MPDLDLIAVTVQRAPGGVVHVSASFGAADGGVLRVLHDPTPEEVVAAVESVEHEVRTVDALVAAGVSTVEAVQRGREEN
jgi:hypothetical protein